jgi:cytochrome c556
MKRLLSATFVTLLGAAVCVPAMAQFAKPEDAIKYRQSAFSVMGTHFGRLGAMANGKVPFDAKAAADNAAIVEAMSKLPHAAFIDGSDKGGNTKALPLIWTEKTKFIASGDKLMAEATKLAAVTKAPGLTLDQLKAAFGNTAGTCKACHDAYKEK